MTKVNIFWFRRDLRLIDNHGLWQALSENLPVLPIFIFDTDILSKLTDQDDARVTFIWEQVERLHQELEVRGSGLSIFTGQPVSVFKQLMANYDLHTVYANRDYEPYARTRDESVYKLLQSHSIHFRAFKDQVIWEKNEVVKASGDPYTVFTPYSKTWKQKLEAHNIQYFPSESTGHFFPVSFDNRPSLADLGFRPSSIKVAPPNIDEQLILHYHQTRDFPHLLGTSRLSVHLRFGTISIRQLITRIQPLSTIFLNELIWREFYMMILWHFPQVVTASFKPAYDHIPWRDDAVGFQAWCDGRTGYPLVDAGMRELNATGYMHNRVRMVTASFLTKHLLIDWRWGEAYFARKLLDFDLAANNGGWQWAAGTGCDAAPYFRVFNPTLQAEKFDPRQVYQRRWLGDFDPNHYLTPIVEHNFARERAIKTYRNALQER